MSKRGNLPHGREERPERDARSRRVFELQS